MLGETTNRTYLSVGYGRIRKKCEKGDAGAVERVTQKGEKTYAVEYAFLSGTLDGIRYRESEEYGNSWVVDVSDGDQHFRLQIPEQSRECGDLLKRIPNLMQFQFYKFTPYEMKEKKKRGLSIKDHADQPVESFYQKYEKNGESWTVTNLHGFPDVDFDSKKADKDDWKVYFIRVNKFLRERALAILAEWGTAKKAEAVPEPVGSPQDIVDDIPPMGDADLPF